MIPSNKKIAVLHPYLDKKWWASSMMIYLSNFLSKNNKLNLYSFSSEKSKLISFFKIAYAIKDSDYVFIWNSPMHFVWVISKLIFRNKAKLIWWHHHYPWYYGSNANVYIKLKRFLEKLFLRKIDFVIANSKYLQDSIKDIYKIDSKILYPVLDNKFLNHKVQNKNKSSNTKTIFTYGRWVEWKNLSLVLEIYQKLKNKVPNLVLEIWWIWDELEKIKNKYEKDENIKFLWFVDKKQIISKLEKSDLFLFTSTIDSFWLVILESMSIWVPVISYNKSWAKEIIKNWVNWFLVNSKKSFIEKSYDILTDDNLRNNLSIDSIKTSKAFSEKTFEKNLNEIFNFM